MRLHHSLGLNMDRRAEFPRLGEMNVTGLEVKEIFVWGARSFGKTYVNGYHEEIFL